MFCKTNPHIENMLLSIDISLPSIFEGLTIVYSDFKCIFFMVFNWTKTCFDPPGNILYCKILPNCSELPRSPLKQDLSRSEDAWFLIKGFNVKHSNDNNRVQSLHLCKSWQGLWQGKQWIRHQDQEVLIFKNNLKNNFPIIKCRSG